MHPPTNKTVGVTKYLHHSNVASIININSSILYHGINTAEQEEISAGHPISLTRPQNIHVVAAKSAELCS